MFASRYKIRDLHTLSNICCVENNLEHPILEMLSLICEKNGKFVKTWQSPRQRRDSFSTQPTKLRKNNMLEELMRILDTWKKNIHSRDLQKKYKISFKTVKSVNKPQHAETTPFKIIDIDIFEVPKNITFWVVLTIRHELTKFSVITAENLTLFSLKTSANYNASNWRIPLYVTFNPKDR